MAYTPTLSDFPQNAIPQQGGAQGYTPTLADFPQSAVPQQAPLDQRFGNAMQQGGTAAALGVGNTIGNIGQTVGNLIKGNGPSSWDAGDQLLGAAIQHAGNSLANSAQQAFNRTNPGLTTKALYMGGQILPTLPLADIGGAGTLSGVGRNIVAGAAQGYLTNPNAPVQGAVTGGITGGALSSIPLAASGIGKGINYLRGEPLQNSVNTLYQTLTNNLAPDEINKNNVQGILDIYNQNKSNLGNQYNALQDAIANRGYATTQAKGTPGIDIANNLKYMQNSPDTSNAISDLVNKNTDIPSLNGLSKSLQQKLGQYQSAPTFANAHDLQSSLGEEAGNYLSGIGISNSDREAGNYLNSLRNNLKGDVQTTFTNNGDQDLGNQLAQLSDNWKNQVIPFRNVPGIKSALNGKNFPKNIITSLNADDEGGSNEAVRNMIAQNPQLSANIIGQSLKSAAGKDISGTGNYIVNPDKFLQSWANLPANIKNIAPNELNNQMDNIVNQANTLQKVRSISKKIGGGLGALGVAHLLGIHELL